MFRRPERGGALTRRHGRWRLAAALLMALAGGFGLLRAWRPAAVAPSPVRPWSNLLRLRAELAAQPAAPPTRPFSPVGLQGAGRRLASWRPTAQGGELVLELQWPQVAETFALLAERGMRVAAFTLQPDNARLRLTLQLEVEDER